MSKFFFSILIFLSFAAQAQPASLVLDLATVLKDAEAYSPRLKGARFEEQAADEEIRVQRSRYLPDISVAAIASTGAPGSFALFDVDSDISSAQRVGGGGAFILKQDLWDFGRTSHAVEAAAGQKTLKEKQLPLLAIELDVAILKTYLNCVFLQAQVKNAGFMADQARMLAGETDRFVKSGQRSVVERYLVDAEAKEAETRAAEFAERLQVTEQRLALALGRPSGQRIGCSEWPGVAQVLAQIEKKSGTSPTIDVQQARVQIARANLDKSRAESRPILYGMAVGGYFDNDHLRDKMNYAAGVGIKLPLFEGFRLDSSARESEAQLHAEEAGLDASKLSLEQANSQYREQVQALQVRLEFLEGEKKLAKDVFTLARKRYVSLQGTMIDLRESIRNMNRVLQSTDEAYRDLYIARGERSLLNGAH